VDVLDLRSEFPVLEQFAYLNAGTDGPLPAAAVRASCQELERELKDGRWQAHFERRQELAGALRSSYARALGCDDSDVALTTCTSEGVSAIVGGLDLEPGQEILTSDEEHPGLLGALQAARDLRGVTVSMVPLREIADSVGANTALVACSHVNWINGSVAPAALAALDVPVLLDGAQGIGAVPLNVHALGCDAYAGSGQKWCCGPDGTGALYVTAQLRERLSVGRRGYANLADAGAGLDSGLREDARRFDTMSLAAETLALALASLRLLEGVGWAAVHERALALAATLAERLQSAGREVARRGSTTLVSFASEDPDGERTRLAQAGVIVRHLPGTPWVRASVGAWNNDEDLDRLLGVVAG
jgi:selenocysteine lyase/cysteine desulfurase